jgi:hypothetical protein
LKIDHETLSLRIASYRLVYARETITPTPKNAVLLGWHLGLLVAEDIRVTSVDDGQGRAAEELTAGGTELNL